MGMTTHLRERHLLPSILKLTKSSPCVGLVGLRQVGKTTLFKSISNTALSFDSEASVARFERESSSLLKDGPFPLLLDEVQKYPKIFSEIKAIVDERRIPGRYLLTGSVRFTLKKDVRESLTGRIVTLELLPLGLAEAHRRESPLWLDVLTDAPNKIDRHLDGLKNKNWASLKQCDNFLVTGGLPGICFHRDVKLRNDQFASQLDTLLGRDLAMLYKSKLSVNQCLEILKLISTNQGLPLNRAMAARKISTTSPTLEKLLTALENLFIIRPFNGGYYIEDQGLATFLSQFDHIDDHTQIRRLVWTELQQMLHYQYRGEIRLSGAHSKAGGHVPFVIETKRKQKVAVFPEPLDRPSNGSLKIATWFQKKNPGAVAVFLHRGTQANVVAKNTFSMPVNWTF